MIYTRITQGTTPFLQFPSKVPISKINNIKATFSQKGKIIITKTLNDCYFSKEQKLIVIPLSQQDTFSLNEKNGKISVIIRISYDKEAIIAQEYEIAITNIEDKEVI